MDLKKKNTLLVLSENAHKRLKIESTISGLTMSKIVEELINDYIEEHERKWDSGNKEPNFLSCS